MRIETEKKLFTADDFSRMYDAGILNNDERVELVDGEIIKLNPGSLSATFGRYSQVPIAKP